ncbi:MAG: DUF1282 domain-containing protein [Deltaproteobacteria bacterium]|nr:MAG: DUF1282 domain-containing protein [Deltaproteobacteria bacterium]
MSINLRPILERVLELLVNPVQAWRDISSEHDPPSRLVWQYVGLLAVVDAACLFLGNALSGRGFWFSLLYAIVVALAFVALVPVQGMLVAAVASQFESSTSQDQATRLAAYCATPICASGIVALAPDLFPLAFLAGFVYSGYLFRLGCTEMLDTPEARATKFAVVATVSWMVMVLVAASVLSRIVALVTVPTALISDLAKSYPRGAGT